MKFKKPIAQANIRSPNWLEFLINNEIAVENVDMKLYPNTKICICLFHINKNIIKCLVDHKLTEFVRKCKTNEELWFYGKLKEVLAIAILPESEIQSSFVKLKSLSLGFIESNINNTYQILQFN